MSDDNTSASGMSSFERILLTVVGSLIAAFGGVLWSLNQQSVAVVNQTQAQVNTSASRITALESNMRALEIRMSDLHANTNQQFKDIKDELRDHRGNTEAGKIRH